jgi:hypothetical protein
VSCLGVFEEDVLTQAPLSKSKLSPLNEILQTVPHLSHDEMLELIAYLAQQARQTERSQEIYYWRDIAGIAPDLMKGQDAQEWISQVRQEWDRDQP